MTKLQIRMRQVDQVKDFVDLLSKYPYEMDLVSGRYTIDAKSLLGILMLSRLVDTFFSRTSWTMLLYAENHSISVA